LKERTFDVFSGRSTENPLWLESVRGLENAKRRMERRSQEKPGDYFLFDCTTGSVVAYELLLDPRRLECHEKTEEA
jgi:hypothetical protein